MTNLSSSRPTPPLPSFVQDTAARSPADTNRLLRTEWLLTNALGGFAMGTALNVPTRRYHALLIAATSPPLGRIVALHSTVDELILDAETPQARSVPLSLFEFTSPTGPILTPPNALRPTSFRADADSVEWTFETDSLLISRRLTLSDGSNACELRYQITHTARPAGNSAHQPAPSLSLRVRPLIALRDMHELWRRDRFGAFHHHLLPDGVRASADNHTFTLSATAAPASPSPFKHDPQWWNNFHHRAEADRRQDAEQDLHSPGVFIASSHADSRAAHPSDHPLLSLTIRATLHTGAFKPSPFDTQSRRTRIQSAIAAATEHASSPADLQSLQSLACAADAFVVRGSHAPAHAHRRDNAETSVIAGYPWFSDWGRDTFISLPGLMLCTGRFAEAKSTLETFARARKRGLIPNVFNDQTGEPEYNTVDGSLWFIHAACEYIERSGDMVALNSAIGEACADVIESYRRGTAGGIVDGHEFRISMDPADHLIAAGSETTQLTWMDARRDGVTFTPRFGKAVEINALWCSALMRLSALHAKTNPTVAANVRDLALAAGSSFARSFWNTDRSCLFDCLVPDGGIFRGVGDIRPNQLFAVSLPHSPLTSEQQYAVLRCVETHLLTPRGVRTLDPANPAYRPRYEGNLFERDGAYHQGTAWPFLTGVYAMAVLRAGNFSPAARAKAREAMQPLIAELSAQGPDGGCPGYLAEVYDADAPQRPSGCPAQAWSVATLLQAVHLANQPTAR